MMSSRLTLAPSGYAVHSHGMTTTTNDPVSRAVEVLAAYVGHSQANVALAIGMAPRTWKRRMATGSWSVAEVRQLAAYFGVREATLLDGPDPLFASVKVSAGKYASTTRENPRRTAPVLLAA